MTAAADLRGSLAISWLALPRRSGRIVFNFLVHEPAAFGWHGSVAQLRSGLGFVWTLQD